jgi:aminobenzoyl-glutamate transport protein
MAEQTNNAPSESPPPQPKGLLGRQFNRFLSIVEWLGNLLPHPVTLFALFCLGIILISGLAAAMGLQVDDPRPPGARGRSPTGIIEARSLLTGDGLRWIVTNLVTNFAGFAPLGTVLVALLGVGVAERSGLLSAAIRGVVLSAPKKLVTVAVVFAGVQSNMASEMGYLVVVPLGAAIFHALGRHPLAGLAAAFAGVSGGYSANLLLGTIDPLLAGITQEAARIIDPDYTVHAAVNWYFMIGSVFLITTVGSLVTAYIVEPRLGRYDITRADESIITEPSLQPLTSAERCGLFWAALAAAAVSLLIVWMAGPAWTTRLWQTLGIYDHLPLWGVLRNPATGSLVGPGGSPLLSGIVALIFIFFFIPGFVYGRITGVMRTDRDIINAMAASMSTMGLYLVLVFFAAQFVKFFEYTELGLIFAVLGADALAALRLDNELVFAPFILMCCFVNLMLGSASAQWAVTAPIFVPMLMKVGYSPEVVQCAYRIGDSTTNIITPMMSYFGLILAFAARYDKKLGIGTLISTMLPYCIFFLIGWMVMFYLWVFVLGIPIGPAAPIYYEFAAPGE